MISNVFKAIGMATVASFIGLFAVLIGVFGIIVFATIGAVMGAITGFIVQVLGIESPDLVAIGAMLGFVGGFFKSNNEINKVDLKIPKKPTTTLNQQNNQTL